MLFAVALGDCKDDFFENVAGAAGERGPKLPIGANRSRFQAELMQSRFGKCRVLFCAAPQIALVQDRQAIGVPVEHFAKRGNKVRLAVFAQPLDLVLIATRPETEQVGDARKKPSERIGKAKFLERAKLVALAEVERSRMHVAAFIECKNQRAFERRSVVRAGGMAKMVIEKEK